MSNNLENQVGLEVMKVDDFGIVFLSCLDAEGWDTFA